MEPSQSHGLAVPAALVFLGEESVRVALSSGPFAPLVLGLLWIAALVRAGVYPFHFWLSGPGHTDAGGRAALHLVVPLTGLWLLGRVNQVSGADWLRRPEWAALGALALLGTAIVAWVADDDNLRWRWVALNRASLIVLAVYMVALAGAQAQVWLLITFALGGALLLVGMVTHRRWGWRWPIILAALAVWGVPGTPGFLARLVLVFPTNLPVAVPLFVLILISEALLVAALWHLATVRWREMVPPGERMRIRSHRCELWVACDAAVGLALVSLIVPLLYWVSFPAAGGPDARDRGRGFFPPPLDLAHTRRSLWIGLALSGLAGWRLACCVTGSSLRCAAGKPAL